MKCKIEYQRICVRVHGVHGKMYFSLYVNWILLLMNMSKNNEIFKTTSWKSP
jgi:hypothetical protein